MTVLRQAVIAEVAAPLPQAPPERARRAPLEKVVNACALCWRADGTSMFRVDGSLMVRCDRCGLVREALRPAATDSVYDAEYYSTESAKGGYANYVLDAEINRITFTERLHAIERRLGRKGRLLDVGCALGDFIEVARELGWDAEGIEISAYAAAQARARGLRVPTGTLEDVVLPERAYDVVTLYDVIEHLTDPVRTLQRVRGLLRPDGVVHVVTPNVGGLQARLLGPRWYHYKPGEHIYLFSPTTAREAIERAGLGWIGWSRSGSYVTLTYVFSRLRYYAPGVFGALEAIGRTVRFGPVPFKLYVGEMELWARRGTLVVV
jgi:2-polyprenyl-3-methyl-5-hydroxy-6-metoxy-1,4-benzoquinol methylase